MNSSDIWRATPSRSHRLNAAISTVEPDARRELLTPAQRDQLLAFPTDEAEIIRLYRLSDSDFAFLRPHRGVHDRLGVAVQIAYLRIPGRPIAREEVPHAPLLAMIASQLRAPVSAWALYAARDQTRREHSVAITRWLGLRALNLHAHRSLSQ
jgi:TnpA family transposase